MLNSWKQNNFFFKGDEIPEEENTHGLHSLGELGSSENHQIQSGTAHQSIGGQSVAAGNCWVGILPKDRQRKTEQPHRSGRTYKSLLTNLENHLKRGYSVAHICPERDLTAKFLKFAMNNKLWTRNFSGTAVSSACTLWCMRDYSVILKFGGISAKLSALTKIICDEILMQWLIFIAAYSLFLQPLNVDGLCSGLFQGLTLHMHSPVEFNSAQ